MAWIELGYRRGWTAYWETHDHRMYAKENSLIGGTKHFDGRPGDRATAWAIFCSWAEER